MAVEKLLRMLFGFKDVKFRNDDDFYDRLSRRHSVCMLILFSIIITSKQYVGDPIHCWSPAFFTRPHIDYTNTICWVKNTYYVPWEEDLPNNAEPKSHISYYQWVPMILLCQAIISYIPSIIWRFLSRRSGLNIPALIDAALAGQKSTYSDIREKTTKYIVNQIDSYLMSRQTRTDNCFHKCKEATARHCCLIYGKVHGNYLSTCYMIVKLLYIANAIGQLLLLNKFLGSENNLYGVEVIHRFINKDDWTESDIFPRVTMCDFKIRHMNQIHQYVIQCVLPINLYNEKIFILVWFWFAFLMVASIMSFMKWLCNLSLWCTLTSYIFTLLNNIGVVNTNKEKRVIDRFLQRYLKRDGVFILRLLGNNMGGLVSMEVLNGLWENFEREFGTGVVSPDKNISTFKRRSRKNVQKANIRLNSLADDIEPV